MQRLTKKDDEGYKLVLKNAVEIFTEDAKRWSISTSTTGTKTIRGYAVDKLAQYEDLEEHGKLLILSCAVGDTVYEVQKLRKRIQPYEIISIKIGKMGEPYYYWKLKDDYGFYSNLKGFGDSRLGEDVFLTKEQAEVELKKINETK